MQKYPNKYFTFNIKLIFISILCLLYLSPSSAQYYIGTFAGNGSKATVVDGSYAACSGAQNSHGVCSDGKGNIYFTDGNSVRKVSIATNVIQTIAGSDLIAGYSGDGGPAKLAKLNFPFDLCIDQNQNLYISEYEGNIIRKIDLTTNIITTVAGNGIAGFEGDGNPAVNASLSRPRGICVDALGNIYIADLGNSRIRKLDVVTNIITTIGGTGGMNFTGDGGPALNADIFEPSEMCFDSKNKLYIVQSTGNYVGSRIREIDLNTGIISTIAGNGTNAFAGDGGLATDASLFDPSGISVDASGNIFITHYDDSRIRKIDATTKIINTIAGNGIRGFSGDGGLALNASLDLVIGICIEKSGDIYISDNGNRRIRRLSPVPFFPFLRITATPNNICSSVPITYNAIVTNVIPGTYNYIWKKNGVAIVNNTNTYTASTLSYDDIISCAVVVKDICNNDVDLKDSITHLSIGNSTPSISITSNTISICPGNNINFSASAKNTGPNPTYQWKINGVNVGTNNKMYASSTINNGDVITCTLTTDPLLTCVTSPIVVSNAIKISVLNQTPPSVTIASSTNYVCKGKAVTFTATPLFAGVAPLYQWKVNGKDVAADDAIFRSSSLSDNDKISCTVTTEGDGCILTGVASSNIIDMVIYNLPVISIYASDTLVVSGSKVDLKLISTSPIATYQWTPSSDLVNPFSINTTTIPIITDKQYSIHVSDNNGCESDASINILIAKKLFMPTAFTPNGDGINDVYRIPPGVLVKLSEFSIYNRWGKKIFYTIDSRKGWDGKIKGITQDIGSYVYVINGIEAGKPVHLKGTFTLIR